MKTGQYIIAHKMCHLALLWVLLLGLVLADIEGANREHFGDNRIKKRSILGEINLKLLLKDAKQVVSQSAFYEKFVKQDTVDRAWADFKAVKPGSIKSCSKNGAHCVEGQLGKYVIRLRTADKTQRDRPSILVFDPGLQGHTKRQIKIIYVTPDHP